MPVVDDKHTPQHQVLINQSILKRLKEDIDKINKDIDDIKESLEFIKQYISNKKKIEESRWFR